MTNYLLRDDEGVYEVSESLLISDRGLKSLAHPIRKKILLLLKEKKYYASEMAKKLKIHEQKIYYHLNQLVDEKIIEVVERKEIRGTIAKKYVPVNLNFTYSLSNEWSNLDDLLKKKKNKITQFLEPFTKKGELNSEFIVGSPDPHGPHKARARDGHYAIDLAMFIGSICSTPKDFTVRLDVDIDWNQNLIIIGGPVTNLATAKVNEFLPVKFSDKKPWGFISKKNHYSEDTHGIICKFKNPFSENHHILLLAGLRFIGTKAAIIGLTRFTDLVLNRYSNQEEFSCVVQGFDLDGDGKLDSIEVLE